MCDTLPTNPMHRDRLPAIKEAFEGFDFDIEDLFNFNSLEEAHEIRKGDIKGWFAKRDLKKLNNKFLDRVFSYEPDILILANLDCFSLFLSPDIIRGLGSMMLTVGFLGDDEYMLNRNAHWLPLFDRTVAYAKWVVDHYNTYPAGRCYWLPNSCHFPEKDFDKLQKKKTNDVFFMGSPFGRRPEILNQIAESGVKLSIFGSEKWNRYESLKPFYKGFLDSDKVDAEVRKSKIVLALLENHLNGALHMTTKPWDAVKNGTLPVCTYYPPLEEDYGFKDGSSVVMARDSQQMVELVNKYLLNDEKRVVVARRMFNRTQKKFDYVKMYRKLFKQLAKDWRSER